MDKKEAIELLSYHSGRNENVNEEKWASGFLGSLRPFKGIIYENNFFEVMNCLKTLQDDFNDGEITQDTLSDLWSICHLTHAWVIHKDSILQTNNVISKEDTEKLEEWIWIISYAVMNLLEKNLKEAFLEYDDYVKDLNKN